MMIEIAIALLVGLAVGFLTGWQYGVFRVGLELEEMEAIARFKANTKRAEP